MSGKSVVVTGGFGALGRATVRAFLEAGWRVAAVDLGEAPEGTPDGVLAIGGVDLADLDSARAAMGKAAATHGGLHALVNVAGGFRWQTLEDGDLSGWSALHRMNVTTAATASKAALPALKASGSGAIVNVAAAAARRAAAGMGAYAASKAGVLRLTESLAEELKDQGVRVNAVLPTIIDTPANRADMPGADFSRWVQPADLAATLLFLASDASRAITGAELLVAGRV
jgi:NAD(P)-dependent dehydrogenase (short-subunit alcohol dehydrogenase family)